MAKKPANTGLRSQYALRLYGWAKNYVKAGTMSISLEDLRKFLGLKSVKDVEGNVIQEPPLPIWANFRLRALDRAIAEITKKTDLRIAIKSLERSKHRRVNSVTFAIRAQAIPKNGRTSFCKQTGIQTNRSRLSPDLDPRIISLRVDGNHHSRVSVH